MNIKRVKTIIAYEILILLVHIAILICVAFGPSSIIAIAYYIFIVIITSTGILKRLLKYLWEK